MWAVLECILLSLYIIISVHVGCIRVHIIVFIHNNFSYMWAVLECILLCLYIIISVHVGCIRVHIIVFIHNNFSSCGLY